MYVFFMRSSQHARKLSIGGVAPLNMVSCLSVSPRFREWQNFEKENSEV